MKTYKVRTNVFGTFLFDVKAKNEKEAEEKALELSKDEYYEYGIDYPHFEVAEFEPTEL